MEAKRPFSQLDWLSTPGPIRAYIIHLEQVIEQMQQRLELIEKRTEKLEVNSKMNSQNSSKPPSSDSPFNKQTVMPSLTVLRIAVKRPSLCRTDVSISIFITSYKNLYR